MHWKEYYYFCIMRLLFCLFFFGSFLFCNAQINNLVVNPSFEDYLYCPQEYMQIESAYPWFQPLPQSSTDYFNACCTTLASLGGVDVPENSIGFQYARTGESYAGFLVYGHGLHKEYLEGILFEPLLGNNKYCVEFYYSLADFVSPSFFTSTIGLFFSTDSILSNSNLSIQVTPQVSDLAINDTINWVKVSGSFTAGGGKNIC
ncbi:MAG: hypothetical protein POELPBGB_01662 [Bacteroidia bacterium]|nr:hypothetical protein [Bacteroidia bacterium]